VDHWCRSKPKENVLVALTEGELVWDDTRSDFDWEESDALPPALRGQFAHEPRYVDLRWAHSSDDLSLRHPQFRDAVADLAAPLHGVPKDLLAGEEVRQHRRTVRVARTAVLALACLTAAAAGFGVLALQQRDHARQQLRVAQSRQLASQAMTDLDQQPARAVLLAIQSKRLSDTPEARAALVAGVSRTAEIDGLLHAVSTANDVTSSPDGRTAAVAHQDGGIRLWDVQHLGRKPPLRLSTGAAGVIPVAFNENGTLLATGSLDGSVRVWHLETGRQPAAPTQLQAPASVHDLVFTGNRLLAVGTGAGTGGGGEGKVTVWDVSKPRTPIGTLASPKPIDSLAFGKGKLAAGSRDGIVTVWDLAQGARQTVLNGSTDAAVSDIAFAGNGALFAAGHRDGVVTVWDVANLAAPLTELQDDSVNGLAFSPDSRMLAIGNGNGRARLWILGAAGAEPRTVYVGIPIGKVAFSPDGTHVALATLRGSTFLWNVAGPQATLTAGSRFEALAFDGTNLAAGSRDGSVRLWSVRNLDKPPLILPTSARVGALALSPDGSTLVAGSEDGTVRFWSTNRGDGITRFLPTTATSPVVGVAYKPGGELLATASIDGTVRLWPATPGGFGSPRTRNVPAGPYSLAFSPDGHSLAVGSDDGAIRILDLLAREKRPLLLRGTSTATVFSVAYSPDGKTLAAGTSNGTVDLWSAGEASREPSDVLTVSSVVHGVAFSPDGRTLAAAGGFVHLWYGSDHAALGRLSDPGQTLLEGYSAVAFSPNGATVVAVNVGGNIGIWSPLPTARNIDTVTAHLCAIVQSNLTREAWRRLLPGRPYSETCPGFSAAID